jgi:N-acetylmuramic acid 6-phosphate (MurNAc-6-P) etherase
LPQALIDALDEPFVSRDALSIAASEIQTIVFERAGGAHTLNRTDGGWQLDGAAAPSEPTLAMLDALAGLRASGATTYAPAAIAEAVLTLRITKRDGAEVTIEIGPASGEGEAASQPVRRTPDVPAGLRCAPSALERVLSYPPG